MLAQALNIPTKINKGTVEITTDVHLIQTGVKVGSSEATLLAKLGIKPFSYGLIIQQVRPCVLLPVNLVCVWGAALTELGTASAAVCAAQKLISLALSSMAKIAQQHRIQEQHCIMLSSQELCLLCCIAANLNC